MLCRCIRYIVSTLPDEFLHALLLLSLFPGSFERRAAAELLGMTSTALSKTRSLLRILTTCNLLQYSSTSERYIMHASVRACCRSLATELGLTYESARYGLRPALADLELPCTHALACSKQACLHWQALTAQLTPVQASVLPSRDRCVQPSQIQLVSSTLWSSVRFRLCYKPCKCRQPK